MRKLGTMVGALAVLVWAPAAEAAVPNVLGTVDCPDNPGADEVRVCQGEAPTFDGVSIDVNVVLPPASQGDGPFRRSASTTAGAARRS